MINLACPTCHSGARLLGATTTRLPIIECTDEHGRAHNHDPNTVTQSYVCPNGHKWDASMIPPCPSCGDTWRFNPPAPPPATPDPPPTPAEPEAQA